MPAFHISNVLLYLGKFTRFQVFYYSTKIVE